MFVQKRQDEEKSEIKLFKDTHVSKSGEFVNAIAGSKYNDMVNFKLRAQENAKKPIQEDAMVKSVLGCRSGYIKGMGHGVQVSRGQETNVFGGVDLKEKLLELEDAKEKNHLPH